MAFALGILVGFPTFVLILSTGLMLGAFVALYASRGLGVDVCAWLLPHGIPELTAIVLCGGAGFALAAAMALPGAGVAAREPAAAGPGRRRPRRGGHDALRLRRAPRGRVPPDDPRRRRALRPGGPLGDARHGVVRVGRRPLPCACEAVVSALATPRAGPRATPAPHPAPHPRRTGAAPGSAPGGEFLLERAASRGIPLEVTTPEGVPLTFLLARAGDRFAAFLIDIVLMFLALFAVVLLFLLVALPRGCARVVPALRPDRDLPRAQLLLHLVRVPEAGGDAREATPGAARRGVGRRSPHHRGRRRRAT